MSKSEELKRAVKELYFWQMNRERATNFHAQLYDLFGKADVNNKHRLSMGFPHEFTAIQMWNEAGDYGNDLFREFGLMEAKNDK